MLNNLIEKINERKMKCLGYYILIIAIFINAMILESAIISSDSLTLIAIISLASVVAYGAINFIAIIISRIKELIRELK